MATKSPTQFHNHWGPFAGAGLLPNVGGSPTQDAALEAGDLAYVTGVGTHQCDTPTPGAAVWTPMGGGGAVELPWVDTYEYTQVVSPSEETTNYGFFDGSSVSGTVFFWTVMTPTLSVPGTAELRLYDVGPKAGPPTAPVLVAVLSTAVSGGPQYLEQALIVGGYPQPNQIQNTERMYEVRAYENSVAGDSIFVGCGGMADR